MTSALVVGATGVVGREVVQQLCEDTNYSRVVVLSRRPLTFSHPKLTVHIVDFDEQKSWSELVNTDVVYCALGTTLKQAGSKAQQRKIDLDLPLSIATVAKKLNVKQFVLVSSSGANPNSSSFYFQTKGQLEQELIALNFSQLLIVRPSVLVGQRSERRFGELTAAFVLNKLAWLPGLSKYQPIKGSTVAKAMLYFAKQAHNSVEIKQLNELFI